MKIFNGIDIIEIDRIKENIEKFDSKFLKKIFTDNEIEYCEAKKCQKFQHYAGRFAAKEAAFKAISSKLESECECSWKDFEVINDVSGRPNLKINLNLTNIEDIDISISHCRLYAVASVTILCKD